MSPLTWLQYLTAGDKLVWSCLMKPMEPPKHVFLNLKYFKIKILQPLTRLTPGGKKNVSITTDPGPERVSHQAYHAECLPRYFSFYVELEPRGCHGVVIHIS